MTQPSDSVRRELPTKGVRQGAIAALLFAATASRLIPHAPNFTAVPAVALMGGLLLGRTWLALFVPLIAMLLSDLALGAAVYGFRAFHWILPVYFSVACTVGIGLFINRRPLSVISGATAATATFFFLTNFFVWLGSSMYSATFAGLMACYGAALPFALNMWLSAVAFALGLLALWQFLEQRVPQLVAGR